MKKSLLLTALVSFVLSGCGGNVSSSTGATSSSVTSAPEKASSTVSSSKTADSSSTVADSSSTAPTVDSSSTAPTVDSSSTAPAVDSSSSDADVQTDWTSDDYARFGAYLNCRNIPFIDMSYTWDLSYYEEYGEVYIEGESGHSQASLDAYGEKLLAAGYEAYAQDSSDGSIYYRYILADFDFDILVNPFLMDSTFYLCLFNYQEEVEEPFEDTGDWSAADKETFGIYLNTTEIPYFSVGASYEILLDYYDYYGCLEILYGTTTDHTDTVVAELEALGATYDAEYGMYDLAINDDYYLSFAPQLDYWTSQFIVDIYLVAYEEESSAWPEARVNEFVGEPAVSVPAASGADTYVTTYSYQVYDGIASESLAIYAYGDYATLVDAYMSALTSAGWTLIADYYEDSGLYVAIDPTEVVNITFGEASEYDESWNVVSIGLAVMIDVYR